MSTVIGILIALLIFGIMIFVHELGHFLAARACGVKVLEFAVGMGPKLISHVSKKSGIRYSLRLLPIGGFTSMLGEDDTSEVDPHALCNRPRWQRFIVLFAGSFMNILTAIIAMFIYVANPTGFATTTIADFPDGESAVYQAGLRQGDTIVEMNGYEISDYADLVAVLRQDGTNPIDITVNRDGNELSFDDVQFDTRIDDDGNTNIILGFTTTREKGYFSTTVRGFTSEDAPSRKAGLRQGDTIIRIGSAKIKVYNDLVYAIAMDGTEPLDITVLRDGEEIVIQDVVFDTETEEGVEMGVMDFATTVEPMSFGNMLSQAINQSFSTVKTIYKSFISLITGKYGINAMSGPVGTVSVISEAASYGFRSTLYLFVFISMNLGIVNLMPFPALDGGRLLFLLIEMIRRKALNPKYENMVNAVGLAVLLCFMAVITILDIKKMI